MDCPPPDAVSPTEPRFRDPELEAMRSADHERDLALLTFSPGNNRRWKHLVIVSMIAFPLATFLFSPSGFGRLWLQLPLAALYGTYRHFARPTGFAAILATLITGTLAQLAACAFLGPLQLMSLVVTLPAYGCAGAIVGLSERSRTWNGH